MKKAIASGIISYVFMGLILFLIIAFFIKPYFENTQEINEEQKKCAFDIKANARTSALSQGDKATAIECPTEHITLEESMSQEEIQHTIAREMVECHELWGSGELLLFDGDGIYCHMCNIIEFEDTEQEPITGFASFLAENPTEKETYFQKITPIKANLPSQQEILDNIRNQDENQLYPEKKYTTMFVYVRGDGNIKEFTKSFFTQEEIEDTKNIFGTFAIGSGLTIVAAGTVAAACAIPVAGQIVCGALFISGTTVAVVGGVVTTIATVVTGYLNTNPPEFASGVFFEELNEESIRKIGCEESFASS